jgi:hypothetical protein
MANYNKLSSLTYLLSSALILFPFLAMPVFAATTAVVSATVTAQNISITLTTDGAVAYGTQTVGGNEDTTDDGINDTETVQNNGNITEDFDIKAANSTNWTLAATAGADQFAHKFCITTCDSSPTWTALTTNDQALAASVAASGTQAIDLQLLMPTSSTVFTQQTLSVTVTASAS